jgi:hypothetical protein
LYDSRARFIKEGSGRSTIAGEGVDAYLISFLSKIALKENYPGDEGFIRVV